MLGSSVETNTPSADPRTDARVYREFEQAHGELRRALIAAIARRVRKTVESVSVPEACSDVPLTVLYHRKLQTNRFTGLVERLFKWWR